MSLILGIDPGSRKTGFGLIEAEGSQPRYITSGIIRLPNKALPERLHVIFESISQIIAEYCPDEMAIEDVFFARDPRAALKLGQARGAAIVAGVAAGLAVSEYAARAVKQSVVGSGAANKEQVQHMVKQLLKLPGTPAEDAADGLAIALCHAQTLRTVSRVAPAGGVVSYSKGRLKVKSS
ncbi:MAG: crossover junction endodeoxyribonuclease RuvC [Porticoccaceae bacterium]|nr:crossover junction endodeoxyribonuclease RuvC [Pseudomonadales bacterium]MCP5173223.1 crossover junction endodeoxyribonuclease RuvC [Pseudomonadales bacterium]